MNTLDKPIKTGILEYDTKTGLSTDETHFECGLPEYLAESLENMKKSLENHRQRQKRYTLGYMLVRA